MVYNTLYRGNASGVTTRDIKWLHTPGEQDHSPELYSIYLPLETAADG